MRKLTRAQHELSGTRRRDRERRPPKPTPGEPIGRRNLPAAVRRELDRLLAALRALPGVAAKPDQLALELAAEALAQHTRALRVVLRRGATYQCRTAAGAVMQRARPEVAIASDAWRRAFTALSAFGLTPLSREKLDAVTPPGLEEEGDGPLDPRVTPLEEFLARQRQRQRAKGASPA